MNEQGMYYDVYIPHVLWKHKDNWFQNKRLIKLLFCQLIGYTNKMKRTQYVTTFLFNLSFKDLTKFVLR